MISLPAHIEHLGNSIPENQNFLSSSYELKLVISHDEFKFSFRCFCGNCQNPHIFPSNHETHLSQAFCWKLNKISHNIVAKQFIFTSFIKNKLLDAALCFLLKTQCNHYPLLLFTYGCALNPYFKFLFNTYNPLSGSYYVLSFYAVSISLWHVKWSLNPSNSFILVIVATYILKISHCEFISCLDGNYWTS